MKAGKLYQPIRVAMTDARLAGHLRVPLRLGREESLERIDAALGRLT